MKRLSTWLWVSGVIVAVAAWTHWQMTQLLRQRSAHAEWLCAELVTQTALADDLLRQVQEAKSQLAAIPTASPTPASPKSTRGAPTGGARFLAIAHNPELRWLHVQSIVNQRKVTFSGLLKALSLTPGQLRRFDEIHAQYQDELLGFALTAEAENWDAKDPRLQALQMLATQTQETRYRELFGSNYEQWVEANRTVGARQVINEAIKFNLQGTGPFTERQADELTQLLVRRRLEGSTAPPDSMGYDWEAILAEAPALLSAGQLEGFRTSVKYLRAQGRMAAWAKQP